MEIQDHYYRIPSDVIGQVRSIPMNDNRNRKDLSDRLIYILSSSFSKTAVPISRYHFRKHKDESRARERSLHDGTPL
jgi:hypothetical protein